MSLFAIPVASFNFDRHDHIWHIYTPEHIKEQASDGKLMCRYANVANRVANCATPIFTPKSPAGTHARSNGASFSRWPGGGGMR